MLITVMDAIEKLKNHRIGVLAGGFSSERDISLKSGKAVFQALDNAGLRPTFLDIEDESLSILDDARIDLAFIALHGRFGEDGGVQRLLEARNILYTGSGPEASRVALDKLESKKRFVENGLSVPGYWLVGTANMAHGVLADGINFPCVVKPRYEGSSIGLSVVVSPEGFPQAVSDAAGYGGDVIAETFIKGREITVGILGDKALPVIEIKAAGGIYDYKAKYSARDTSYVVPAEIPADVYKTAQATALSAHSALGCRGLSRVDMILSLNDGFFVLEVNTIPGFTERSLLPMAAGAAGINFTELCLEILMTAFQRDMSNMPDRERQTPLRLRG